MRETHFSIQKRRMESTSSVRLSELALEVFIQGKWRINILWMLRHGPVRLGELGRLLPGASKKVLAQHLRRLEADGIVIRKDMSDLVLHIEYELHPSTENLVCGLLDKLSETGAHYLNNSSSDFGASSKPTA